MQMTIVFQYRSISCTTVTVAHSVVHVLCHNRSVVVPTHDLTDAALSVTCKRQIV